MNLVDRALAGDRRALGQLLRRVEDGTPDGRAALRALYPRSGHAHVVGITGAPGSGKSTLVNALALAMRRQGKRVAIVPVDPSSPLSGGAVLGDRIRMQDLAGDPGVFIKSMAAREALGGLAETTGDVITILDAVGNDVIVVETVGVGQAEVDIVREAHTTIVVLVPGMGDDIQAMKAGLLEVADIFVVNKADREGADAVVRQLRTMIALGAPLDRPPPIVPTVATTGEGVDRLREEIDAHFAYLAASSRLDRLTRRQAERRVLEVTRTRLLARLSRAVGDSTLFEEVVAEVAARKLDPYSAADRLIEAILPTQ
ncbi:MAG: methylmalonyl Co-A mutase-associated GTPase MeaB [Chloroflexota bacterium]|nr:methylmalonyl Co-A mutase-associated GTPase MeaB [Dehalococcoidia bacterium]MDW8252282.1 methylmalonyl Co-A mutase-associated GTPase MeaB [Chloroflexota bacterium]